MDFDRMQNWTGLGALSVMLLGVAALGLLSSRAKGSTSKRRGRKVVKVRGGKQFREYPKVFHTKLSAQEFAAARRKEGKRARVEPGRIAKQTMYVVLIG